MIKEEYELAEELWELSLNPSKNIKRMMEIARILNSHFYSSKREDVEDLCKDCLFQTMCDEEGKCCK